MHPSTALARVLVDELVRRGVREVVLAPGSRSAPLGFALHAAAQAGRLRLHVRIDERTAAFLALGLAKASEPARPTVVVTTSGTAVANLHPAILEAHHAGVPLVVLTADRPPELRGVGANQTTDQVGLFGSAVRTMTDLAVPRREPGQVRYWRDVVHRAVVAALGTRSNDPGPVHLNVGLAEPLVPTADDDWVEALAPAAPVPAAPQVDRPRAIELLAGPRTVVLAGDGAGWAARRLADTAGWPLLAEPSSGARSGPNAVGAYRLLLDTTGLGAEIERVVVYGRPTLSRSVTRLLARDGVEVVVVSKRPAWSDPSRRAAAVLAAVAPPGTGDAHAPGPHASHGRQTSGDPQADAWLLRWRGAAAAADAAIALLLDAADLCGPAVARAVAGQVSGGGLLYAGSSNAIRDLDLAMRPYQDARPDDPLGGRRTGPPDPADRVRVLANRGLAGIDGTVSSAVGAALGRQRANDDDPEPHVRAQRHSRPAYALMGDLTFLHDATGLVIGPQEERPNLVLVVLNDDGGGIFHTLEPGAAEHAASFERLFGTAHGVDLAALCAATRTPYERADTIDGLRAALESPECDAPSIRVVEARVDRASRRDLHRRLAAAVATAVG